MKGSTIKTLAAFLLALLVVIGLGAFFWPTTSQQIPTFRLTPTRVSQTTNTAIPPSPTGVSNQGSTPIPSATLMAIAPKVETVMATIVITATPNEPKASETPTPQPNNGPVVHTVKAGDNMFRLSVNYGVSLSALAAANRLRTDAVLKVGQTLVIPSTTNAPPNKPATTPSVSPNATATKSADITTTLATPVSQVNGLPIASFVVLPAAAKNNIRQIYAKGQALGNNANVFAKVGDSTIEPPHFLDRFDSGPYVLGPYAYLQPVISYYAGSFARPSLAVKRGLSGWGLFDALWADREKCLSDEGPLACELRLNKPSVAFIRIGSNDGSDPATFDKMMRKAVEYCIEQGVIPLIGTKADRFQDPDGGRNRVLRQLTAEYNLPLWDFDLVAQTIPDRGLENDNVHLTTYWLHDYSLSGALYRGHGAHSITALIALDQVWKALNER